MVNRVKPPGLSDLLLDLRHSLHLIAEALVEAVPRVLEL